MNPEITRILIGIGKGIAYGAVAAGIGYLKTQNPQGGLENFDAQKFTKTVIIGMFVGGIAGAGITDENWNSFAGEFGVTSEVLKGFIMTGITWLTDEIVKVLWRRFLEKVWIAIKARFS